jgi:hypothetical protein
MIKQWYARAIGGAFACSIALIAVALFSLFASAQVPIDRATEKTAVEQMYRDYVAAFSADDDPRKAAAYCLEPTMLVGPRLVRVLNSTTETEKWIVEVRSSMRSRGVADVVIDQLNVKLLGQNIAFAVGNLPTSRKGRRCAGYCGWQLYPEEVRSGLEDRHGHTASARRFHQA